MKAAGAVLGTGVDIVATGRIARSIDRFGQRFLDRCFRAGELADCRRMREPARHLAARFAAKEAVGKAFGTGLGGALGWRDIEIRKRASGEPFVVLHGRGIRLARRRKVRAVLVSYSHCREYAVAQAMLVGGAPPRR